MNLEYVSCNLCGADETTLLYPSTLKHVNKQQSKAYHCTNIGYGFHHAIVQCCKCGLVYANPRFPESKLLAAYQQVVDPLYEQEREGRVLTFQRHLKAIEELIGDYRGKRLLDVGAYTGVFVELAGEHGWDAYGIELSLWAAELCHQKGLNVKRGTLNDVYFSDNYFDVVTSWDVIEHLNDPHTHLADIHRILKPGGLLVIHTIDIDAPFARLMGAHWPWLMEMHLVYFSRRTLALMLEDVGFDVIRAEAEGRYQKISYLISRLNAVSERLWHLTDWLSRLLRVDQLPVPIKLGDLVTTVSIKKDR